MQYYIFRSLEDKFEIMTSIILAVIFNWNMSVEAEKPKFIYVGDPMCSWCYGISEELSKTVEYYGDKIDLEVVMGGLRAGGGEEWNESFKTFLRHHWEDVGMKSGQPFKFDLLDKATFDYDTEPACRAVVTVSDMEIEKVLPFFQEVQKGFYLENKDPKEVEFYRSICVDMDINFEQFSSKFESSEMKNMTINHFRKSAELGARSFPTLLLEYKGKREAVAVGYSTFDKMKGRIDKMLH